MSGRAPAPATSLRVDILKELQALIDNREYRDRVDRGPLAETKGREHWVLHLLLRADELQQTHLNSLVGTAYSNLLARLQSLEDRQARIEELETAATTDVRERIDALSATFSERVDKGIDQGVERMGQDLTRRLGEHLDQKWKPIGESIETFAVGSRQVLKDVADTYRVATQTRLLLNENARRITDLGRDLLALEDSLKLVVQKAIEDSIAPIESRLSALESHNGMATPPRDTPEKAGGVTTGNGS